MKTFDGDVFIEGVQYTVGTNDGQAFRKVTFKGRSNNAGKQVLQFEIENNANLTINPSYMSWAVEENGIGENTKWAD
jgi:hypothetical protein